MNIFPRKPWQSYFLQLINAVDQLYYLVKGTINVYLVNTSIAATQSGTWSVTVSDYTATTPASTRVVYTPSDASAAIQNHHFTMHYVGKKAVT